MDKTYTLIKFCPKRTFGVELEFGRDSSREFLKECVIKAGEPARVQEWAHNHNNTEWICKTDSSCGYEVASRVMGSTRSIRKTVTDIQVLETVVATLRDMGAKITNSCGTHVHIWVGDFSKEELRKLMYYWARMEKTLMDMMPDRRKKNRYCPGVSGFLSPDEEFNYHDLYQKAYHSRNSLNMGWVGERSTVEFRLAEGSVDPVMIKNWTRFLLFFVEKIKDLPTTGKANWLTLRDVLILLDLYNPPEAEEFKILSPALAETRSWILRRINENAGYRDALVIKEKAKKLLEVVG